MPILELIRLKKKISKNLVLALLSSVLWSLNLTAQQQLYLSRFVPNLKNSDVDLTVDAVAATYKPIFGEGDKDGHWLNSISRIGELTVQPNGASTVVSRPGEEYVLYVTQGEGTLIYGSQEVDLKKNDFLYIPAGVSHGISNSGRDPIRVLFMGYKLPEGIDYKPKQELQIANANEVELQVLGSHGPTTQYKLLLGDINSTRDRLACASQVKSLFIMDFSPNGTNNPHRHPIQEEVYFVLQGQGYMVAGLDAYGNEQRHPSQAGDAFYWAAGTEVGFYSLTKEGEKHSIILAIRADDPTKLEQK